LRNPLRSEAEAYRLVWLTIGYFILIVAGAAINVWLGVIVFVIETAVVLWLVFGRRSDAPPPPQVESAQTPEDERRILVVANETVGGHELLECIERKSEGVAEKVLVVCPALNSPLRHWVSDEDDARASAQERLDASVASMRAMGIEATGEIGDGDPLQAIEDAVRTFAPDEVVVSTHPEGRSHWLERGVVDRARERFHVPLTHVVVDLEAGDRSSSSSSSSS
jgi:GABA permease